MPRTVVVAIGGNSLITDSKHQTVPDQYHAVEQTCAHLTEMLRASDVRLVVTHGNGPQVGFILQRSEIASSQLHQVPLDSCVADTQGALGYQLQRALHNAFRAAGIRRRPVTVVTQVLVDARDPAFGMPTKPIGSFLSREKAEEHRRNDGWAVAEDAGRGWRRVVSSPRPMAILEIDAVRTLLDAGFVVIAAGGGGIAVVEDGEGDLAGAAAVVDKDLASSLLARQLGADLLVVSTAVERVCLDYGKPTQRGAGGDDGGRGEALHGRGALQAGQHAAQGRGAGELPGERREGGAHHRSRPPRRRPGRPGRDAGGAVAVARRPGRRARGGSAGRGRSRTRAHHHAESLGTLGGEEGGNARIPGPWHAPSPWWAAADRGTRVLRPIVKQRSVRARDDDGRSLPGGTMVFPRRSSRSGPALLLVLSLAACGRQAPPVDGAQIVPVGTANLFQNGDFETGDLSGWDPVVTNLNGTLSAVPPTTVAQLNLQAGGTNLTHVITGVNGQVVPALLSAAGSTLRIPRYGTHVAVVNEYSSSTYGHGQNVNTLKQSMTISNADVDPADGKVHVRFAIAPVLENPSHADNQQPYFWIQLWNTTRSAQLFYTFNFSNQSGVPWKTDTTTGVLYTDWKAFDISPGPAQLAVGDQVELRVVAAGCSLGGHDGHVYVDSFGPILPGLSVTATAPQSVNRGSTLTYTLTYKNAGPGGADGVVVSQVLPANTTFASVSAPGATCTTPAVGAAGTVTCNLGTLNEATTGSFTITVNVAAGAAIGSYISNGNYQIQGNGVSALIGPLVQTLVSSGVTYADLSVTASDNQAAVGWGAAVTYTIVASNAGPGAASGATITAPLPAQLTGATWDCAATGGAVCPAAGGTFPTSIPTLASGSSVTIHQYASVVSGSGSGSVAYQVTVATPAGVTNPDSTNNVAVDTDSIGTLHSFTVSKAGHGTGTVVSVPTAISCGSTCAASFLDATTVVLTATAAPGSLFTGWSGACTGTSTTCTTTVFADATTTATFILPHTITASAPAGNGTISCTSPVDDGASTTCTLTPASHDYLTALADNGSNVLGSVSGGTYVSNPVTSNRTIVATFSPTVSSLTLGVAPGSPVSGQPVTITATAAGVGPLGTPTGAVTFYAGGIAIPGCSGVSLVSGAATCAVARAAGTYALTATYGGDATWNGCTAPGVQLVVGPAGTTTQVVSSLNPSSWGAPVSFTVSVAAVAPGTGTPGGQVELFDGATSLGTATLDGSGQVGLTTSALAAGGHTITAVYGGASSFSGSASPDLTQVVVRASATVALSVAPTSSVFGQLVTLTATVSSSAGIPTGTVDFYAGGVFLGTGTVQPDGTATLVTGAMPVGTSSITASYQGSTNHAPADSSAGSHTVTAASSQMTVSASPVSPTAFGQAVTFTATVSAVAPGSGTPTGSVEFRADGSILAGCAAVVLSGGTATCSTSSLAVGGHPIVATYSGSTGFLTSTSSTLTHTVNAASSQVALGANPASTVVGQSVTFTATVSAVAPGAGTPTGTVEFRADGSILAGCGAVTLSSGTATCSTSSLSVGGHPVMATFSGSTSFQGSTSSTLTYTVNAASSQVALGANPASTVLGQSVTFTATVSAVAPGAGTPTGAVEFRADGSILAGCAAVALSGGTATCSTSSLAVGGHPIVATYSASTSFLTSTSSTLAYTVGAASSQVALGANPASTVLGQAVTFTATVSAVAPASGTPAGTVEFRADGAIIAGCAAAALSGSTATCSTSALAVGGHPIVAIYSGSASFQASTSSTLTYTVGAASSQVALAPNPTSPTVFGQSVTFTATVTAVPPGVGTPTGAVEFRADGSILAGCGAVALSSGAATCSTSSLAVGGHPIVVAYAGSTSFHASTSPTLSHSVNAASSQVALGSSPSPSLVTQSVTFTATVTAVAPGAGTPTGLVEFRADGSIIAGCAAVALSAGTATCSTAALAAGGHPVAAAYGGSASFQSSETSLTQTVNKAATTTGLAAAPSPSVVGQAVTLTATVSSAATGVGTPSGTVTFKDGAAVLGTADLSGAGVATLPVSTLAAGGHSLTAEYGATEAFLGSTGSTETTVAQAATTTVLAATPSPTRLADPVTLTATVAAVAPGAGTPAGTITFRDGGTLLGTAALDGAGVATLSGLTQLALGGHGLTADYGGSASFLASQGAASLTVQQGTTAVAVASSLNPSRYGRPVTFTATVTSSGGTPDGTVTFREGETVLGATQLDDAGVARLTLRDLRKGTHPISAGYGGSTHFQAASAELAGGQVVENSPPVAGSGDALLLGGGHAIRASASGDGQLELARTVELWARADWTAPDQVAGAPTLLRVGDDTAPRYALAVAADRASLVVSYGENVQSVAAALGDGSWHHLALTSSDGTITVLVDGAAAAALPGSFDDEAGDDVLVGDGFVGAIDEVRLWTTARTPADLVAGARRPVAAGAEGLAALWRMDDHLGTTSFDAGPGAVDLEATLPAETEDAAAFGASTAWRRRTATSGQPMTPADAGYDVDGDELTLSITAAPAHGTASVGSAALQIGYTSVAEYGGADELTFQLDDGQARSSFALEVAVTATATCRVDADCADGNLCAAGVCTKPGDLAVRSGGGCSSSGAAPAWALLGLALAGLLHRRRAAARALLAAALLAGGFAAGSVRAQTPSGFELQTYEPAPAGDHFFVVPGTAVEGNLRPAAGLVLSWAKDPLVLKRDGKVVPDGKLVRSQTWGWAIGSLIIADRVLVDVAVPVALSQHGDKPFSSFDRVTSSALGDVRLGGRTPLPSLGPVALAAGLDLWLPTGQRQAFSSDGAVRALPKVIAGGHLAGAELGADVGLLVRRDKDVTLTRTGTALAFAAGATWPVGPVRVGPEVYGRWQFQGKHTSPVEALLGARYALGDLDLGLAAGTAFDDSPGAAPLRVVGQVVWRPRPAAPPPAAPAPAPAAAPPPDRDGDGIPDDVDACPDQPGPGSATPSENGCPPPPPPPAAEPLPAEPPPAAAAPAPAVPPPAPLAEVKANRIEILQPITFETDRDVIQPGSVPVLEEVAHVLAAHPGIAHVRIEGYTDSRGSAAHNTALSDRRARVVRRWLVDKGIAAGRLGAKGFGPARPVADNATPEGRAVNRRVEFRIE